MDKFHSDLRKLSIASGGIAALSICFFGYTFITTPPKQPVSSQQTSAPVKEDTSVSTLGSTTQQQPVADIAQPKALIEDRSANQPKSESTASDQPSTSFGDGTMLVGIDIAPGTYESSNPSPTCRYESLVDGETIEGNIERLLSGNKKRVTMNVSDKMSAVMSTDCGTWKKIN